MKSKPETSAEFTKFDETVRQVLSVSKEELERREAAYRAERAGKPKHGPSLSFGFGPALLPKAIRLDCQPCPSILCN